MEGAVEGVNSRCFWVCPNSIFFAHFALFL